MLSVTTALQRFQAVTRNGGVLDRLLVPERTCGIHHADADLAPAAAHRIVRIRDRGIGNSSVLAVGTATTREGSATGNGRSRGASERLNIAEVAPIEGEKFAGTYSELFRINKIYIATRSVLVILIVMMMLVPGTSGDGAAGFRDGAAYV